MTRLVRSKLEPLTPDDICDRCPARARLAVLVGDKNGIPVGPLLFCLHCGTTHADALWNSVSVLDVIADNRTDVVIEEGDPEVYHWIEDLLK